MASKCSQSTAQTLFNYSSTPHCALFEVSENGQIELFWALNFYVRLHAVTLYQGILKLKEKMIILIFHQDKKSNTGKIPLSTCIYKSTVGIFPVLDFWSPPLPSFLYPISLVSVGQVRPRG